MSFTKTISTEEEMLALGAAIARACTPGMTIGLHGDLGAGKTVFCRGFLRALGHEGNVKSPTYTLVEPYELASGFVYHFDLYRLSHPDELSFIGLDDYLTKDSIALIEWPEQGKGVLPALDIVCHISIDGDQRAVRFEGATPVGDQALAGSAKAR